MNRREAISLLEKTGTDMSKIDEDEIERLRSLGTIIRSMDSASPKNEKRESKTPMVKSYLYRVISAWCIWGFILFTLDATNIKVFYDEEEWLAWIFLPPLSAILILVWIKVFGFPRKPNKQRQSDA